MPLTHKYWFWLGVCTVLCWKRARGIRAHTHTHTHTHSFLDRWAEGFWVTILVWLRGAMPRSPAERIGPCQEWGVELIGTHPHALLITSRNVHMCGGMLRYISSSSVILPRAPNEQQLQGVHFKMHILCFEALLRPQYVSNKVPLGSRNSVWVHLSQSRCGEQCRQRIPLRTHFYVTAGQLWARLQTL